MRYTSYKKKALSPEEQKERALLRNIFLSQDNYSITQILRDDLLRYLDGWDIGRMKMVSLDHFTKSVMERIIQVHKSPLAFRFEDAVSINDKEKFSKLMNDVKLHQVLSKNDLRLRLHNTFMTAVRYYPELDRLWLDNSFDASNTQVISYPGMPNEVKTVIRYDASTEEYWIWDRKEMVHYYIKDKPEVENGMITNTRYAEISLRYFPFVTYRYDECDYGFWQVGYDSIVEMNRLINVLYTIISDDTVQETMRILILNFIPQGTGVVGYDNASSSDIPGQDAPKELKTGMRNPVYGNPWNPDREPSAQVVSADLFNTEVIETIEKLGEQLSSLHGVDNVLKDQLLKDVSGIALKIKNENMVINWKKDITICRPLDRELIEKIVEVNNLERPDRKVNESMLNQLTIDYPEPSIVTDDFKEFELEKEKWERGVSNPILYVQRKNPEMTEKQAMDFIKSNLSMNEEFFGLQPLATGSLGVLFTEDIA